MEDTPKKGDLRIWWIPQIPMKSFDVDVRSFSEASKLLDVLASYDAFQFENNVKGDYCNTGGLQEFDGSDWFDWESDDFDSFDEVRSEPVELAKLDAARAQADAS